MPDLDELVRRLLSTQTKQLHLSTMADWFDQYKSWAEEHELAIDRSIVGGRQSSCLAFAFAAGYQSAIAHLFGETEPQLASLCVTESGGNHPRAIATTLFEVEGQLRVSGSKTFISGARDAELMFVACQDIRNGNGFDEQGRPKIKVVRIQTLKPGIEIKEMPALGFLPEISHGTVTLDDVSVSAEDILEGDGYQNYVKPFRTYEDVHVLTAITAYRLSEAVQGKWPEVYQEAHLSLLVALRSLASMDLLKPPSHILLSACRSQLHSLIEDTDALFSESSIEGFENWKRDSKLLSVAKKAHEKRTENARESLFGTNKSNQH